MRIARIISITLALLAAFPAAAQEVEMADTMRANGKIYVLVAIVVVILAGLLAYVVRLDRKVSGLEKKLEGKN